MFKTLLKNQHVTYLSSVEDAEKHSPFKMELHEKSGTYTIRHKDRGIQAAGLCKDDAEAAIVFYANNYIHVENGKSRAA